MVVNGEKNHRNGEPAEMAALAEMAMPTEMVVHAEHRTSQRTQTSRQPGQPIAMSEKSSNFALAFEQRVEGVSEAPR